MKINIKKISPFYIVYFTIVAVFLIVLISLLGVFRGYLEDYENAQPIHVVERIMKEYFSDNSLEKVIDEFAAEITDEAKKAELSSYLQSIYTGDFTYNSTSVGEGDLKYSVSCNGKRVATFSLKESGETSKNGFTIYTLDKITLKMPRVYKYTIEAPSDYVIKIDGKIIGSDNCVESGIPTASSKHMYGDLSGITYNRYEVKSYNSEPEFSAVTPRGNAAEISYDNATGKHTVAICYDHEMSDTLKNYVTEAIEKFAIYMQNDSWFGAISKYYDPTSDLYTSIQTADTWCVIDHDSWSFEDHNISEYYEYSDDVISCRISMTHLLHVSYMEDYKDYIDMTVYLRKVDGNFLIYDTLKH